LTDLVVTGPLAGFHLFREKRQRDDRRSLLLSLRLGDDCIEGVEGGVRVAELAIDVTCVCPERQAIRVAAGERLAFSLALCLTNATGQAPT